MQVYLVGGAVRDELLGLNVKDRDWVVVGATPEAMLEAGYRPVGSDFPVFLHPETHEEYALARTERKTGRGYKGFTFHTDPNVTLDEDLLRRDLTINSMAKSQDGVIIDPFNGQTDLKNRVLRHVSDAFLEDPLRVLRVARFQARFAHLGFHIAPETVELMQSISTSGELNHLTAERVWQEFERALNTKTPSQFLATLDGSRANYLLTPLDRARSMEVVFVDSPLLQTAEERFALLCHIANLSTHEVETLALRLKIPNRFKSLAITYSKYSKTLSNFSSKDPEQKLQLISDLKLIKHPDAVEPLLRIQSALQPDNEFNTTGLERAIKSVAAIEPKQVMADGFSGAELGSELRRRQVEALSNLSL
jgi:tRNA nucleotidyltransferase (CCA-adding enzyme)